MKPITVQDARRAPVPKSVFDLATSAAMVPRDSVVKEDRVFNACILYGSNVAAPEGLVQPILMAYRAGSTEDWNHRIVITRGTLDGTIITLEDPGLSTYATLESKFAWPGVHTEDPRMCWVPSGASASSGASTTPSATTSGASTALFLTYTDGSTVGIAKLDPSDLSTIYTHYLRKPPSVQATGHTGLEKNWIPFNDGTPDTLYMVYSDTPRTIFKFTDNGTKLVYESVWTHKSLRCAFGEPRGGAPPVLWRRAAEERLNEYIWFFHTKVNKLYHIGAYVTVGFQSVRFITPTPLFTGNQIVFQCGALAVGAEPSAYLISAGIHDMEIVFLKVPRSQVPLVPAELF